MQGETHEQAAARAIQPVLEQIREEQRRVLERIRSRDEDGRPRLTLVEPQIEDAAERERNGIF